MRAREIVISTGEGSESGIWGRRRDSGLTLKAMKIRNVFQRSRLRRTGVIMTTKKFHIPIYAWVSVVLHVR
jgi:hypothetical protein